ncbi:hypothetical protein [Salinirussus salinus]|uniref:hypothetical protein n=1 Tax=Salinirussus salinus TaxID=1198300 RepID=UPI0013588907|nr:hypothetical protein [Salinirussus salinus]
MAPEGRAVRQKVSTSRRRLLAAAGTAAAGLVAGCSGLGGGNGTDGGDGGSGMPTGSADPSSRMSAVPARANGLVYVDYEQLRTDEDLQRLLDTGVQSGAGADSVQGALESQGLEGIDPAQVYDMMVFTEVPEDDPMAGASSYAGAVVWTGLEPATVTDGLQSASDAELTEETHSGQTVLLGESGTSALGVVSEGVYAVGTEQVVRDAIDVGAGDGDAVGGTVTDALANTTDAPIRFAVDLPTGTFSTGDGGTGGGMGAAQYTSELDVLSGAMFYESGDEVGLRLNGTMTSESVARETEQLLGTFKQQYLQQANQMQQGGEELERMLNNLQVSRDGNTVSVSYTDTVDNLIELSEGGAPMGGPGMGG